LILGTIAFAAVPSQLGIFSSADIIVGGY